jgi:hypothetical protein
MVARYGTQGGLGYWLTGEPLPKAMGLPLVGEPTRLHEAGRRNTFLPSIRTLFHSPILATTGNEVRGHTIVVKILQTAFACYGMPRNVEEFQNPDGRYIVTFDGSIDGNLIQIAILVTENAAHPPVRAPMAGRQPVP